MFTASQGLLFLRKFLAFHWHNYKAHSKKLTKAKNLNSLYLLQNEKKKNNFQVWKVSFFKIHDPIFGIENNNDIHDATSSYKT